MNLALLDEIEKVENGILATILETEGHESLHRASLAAMEGGAPFRPLPQGFPDENLVVTVRFVYLPPGAAPPRDAP